MSWRAIARNDIRAARRARGTWGLVFVFLLAYLGLAAAFLYGTPNFTPYVDLLGMLFALLVPLLAIVFGYESVIGERASGMAALTLSFPHSRLDLAVGKFVARTAVLAVAIGIGTLLAGIVTAATFDGFDPLALLGLGVASIAYGAVFMALATGLSMGLSTTRRVITSAFGAYLGLVVFWTQFVDILALLLFRLNTAVPGFPPTWTFLAKFLSPNVSFSYLLAEVVGVGPVPTVAIQSDAWFISPIVAIAVLAVWGLLPFFLGYRRFRRGD
ncbi:MAG: ABC transporter permease subunit, partial [Halobacteriales archaeon]|nr:ABC transporter permease subunit [Halobacteriales archaeon]